MDDAVEVQTDAELEEAEFEAAELAEADLSQADETDLEDAQEEADVEDVLLLEEVDQELVLAVWEPTGEPRVDAALDLLATLDPDDVHQHAAVFDDIHQQLRGTLTDLDAATS